MKRVLPRKWREIAREIFVECDGDIEACRNLFKQRYGSVAAILLILEILVTLWKLWKSLGIDEPPAFPMHEEFAAVEFEPGDDD